MKYSVMFTVDATISVEVEADSIEEAKEKASDIACGPSICHQCADQLFVGDVMDLIEVTEID